jgi:hypothetical protein
MSIGTSERRVNKVPSRIVEGGRASLGSFEGSLGRLDFSGVSALTRVKRLKRWVYVGIATERHYVGLAVVRLGYAANAFAFVLDTQAKKLVVDRALILPVTSVDVSDTTLEGARAAFAFRGSRIVYAREGTSERSSLSVRLKDLRLDAELDATHAPPAISAVVPTEHDLFTTTEKRVLLDVKGDMDVAGERVSLDQGLAGVDYTAGFMPRHTRWKWAFALGRVEGVPFGFNLVEGFVREAECAAFFDGKMWPLREGDIRFRESAPLGPWHVGTVADELDLRFEAHGMHEDRTNLGIVRAKFVQPAGIYSGKVRLGGRELVVDRMLGVTEDQSVVW